MSSSDSVSTILAPPPASMAQAKAREEARQALIKQRQKDQQVAVAQHEKALAAAKAHAMTDAKLAAVPLPGASVTTTSTVAAHPQNAPQGRGHSGPSFPSVMGVVAVLLIALVVGGLRVRRFRRKIPKG